MTIEKTEVLIQEVQSTNNLTNDLFKFDWPPKSHNEICEKEEKHEPLVKSATSIKDIPIQILKQIISHTCVITNKRRISSLRQHSPKLTLWMRCQTHLGTVINLDIPLQRGGLNNKYVIEFFTRVNHEFEKPIFVESYRSIDFYYVFTYCDEGKKSFRKEIEISRLSMISGKIINPCVNSDVVMIDLDFAFQYIPYEPMTFRVKAISFSPIYVLDWFNVE
ncbi:19969_t:CDS:2 [Funneliformis geosporum]|uniref:17205_t:CDS:1 n=1 Tax=Funneliformis geosporum TaxID=1117311 RepID=A0A9W4SJD6_9GLOM|nr:17205_t:CDS:2 [Funneliformis geosporum]CAI2176863.1 19969_t:CDS:2 [Funneliformis geosporum]